MAWAGFILGHVIGEGFLPGPQHERQVWLGLIGPNAMLSILPAGLVILTASTIRARGRVSVARTASTLAAVQVPLCAAMGILGSDPLHGGLADPMTWAALGVQVVLALLTATLLALLVAGVELVVARLRRKTERPQIIRSPALRAAAHWHRDLLVRCRRRAPPALLPG